MGVAGRLRALSCAVAALLGSATALAASPKVAASLSSAFGTPALLECHFASGRSQAEAVCPSSRGGLAAAAAAVRAASLLEAHPLTQAFAPASGGSNGSIRVRFPMATGAAPLPGFAERSELAASLRAAAALTAARWQVAVHHHEEAMRSVMSFACSPVPGGSGQLYHDMEPRRSLAACSRFGGWGTQRLLAKWLGRRAPEPPRCAGVAAQLRAAVRTMAHAMEALPGLEQALAAAGSALRSAVEASDFVAPIEPLIAEASWLRHAASGRRSKAGTKRRSRRDGAGRGSPSSLARSAVSQRAAECLGLRSEKSMLGASVRLGEWRAGTRFDLGRVAAPDAVPSHQLGAAAGTWHWPAKSRAPSIQDIAAASTAALAQSPSNETAAQLAAEAAAALKASEAFAEAGTPLWSHVMPGGARVPLSACPPPPLLSLGWMPHRAGRSLRGWAPWWAAPVPATPLGGSALLGDCDADEPCPGRPDQVPLLHSLLAGAGWAFAGAPPAETGSRLSQAMDAARRAEGVERVPILDSASALGDPVLVVAAMNSSKSVCDAADALTRAHSLAAAAGTGLGAGQAPSFADALPPMELLAACDAADALEWARRLAVTTQRAAERTHRNLEGFAAELLMHLSDTSQAHPTAVEETAKLRKEATAGSPAAAAQARWDAVLAPGLSRADRDAHRSLAEWTQLVVSSNGVAGATMNEIGCHSLTFGVAGQWQAALPIAKASSAALQLRLWDVDGWQMAVEAAQTLSEQT